MRVEDGFQQIPYQEPNPYTNDPVLPDLLKRYFTGKAFGQIESDLTRFGERTLGEIRSTAELATPPTLTQYNQWGQRVDRLDTSEGWRKLKAIVQSEGLIAIHYEREFGDLSRIYGFAKIMICVGDAQVVFCPFAMTDGAARVIELMGTPEMKRYIFSRLVSRNPEEAFTAGQWMTEKSGGSDVSRTETIATPASINANIPGATYKLDGFKWFSSATDSNVSVTLARTGPESLGSRGISLFLVPLRLPLLPHPGEHKPSSTSNNILIHRLKNKIGTHVVPTAELSINGAEAYLLSTLNGGIKAVASVLNITRMHSASGSVGYLRKGLAIATAYASVRRIQGQTTPLRNVPLHTAELAKISLIYRALSHFFFGVTHLLGKTECGTADAGEKARLRMLTPTLKAFAADKGVTAVEECMAALGGLGYMEETGLGRLIRDGLVERIWEGTVVVLSLDLVRACADSTAIPAYSKWASSIIADIPLALLAHIDSEVKLLQAALTNFAGAMTNPVAPLVPRPALMLFGYISAALYLLEHAIWSYNAAEKGHEIDADVFVRWIEEAGFDVAVRDVRMTELAGIDRLRTDEKIVYAHAEWKAKL